MSRYGLTMSAGRVWCLFSIPLLALLLLSPAYALTASCSTSQSESSWHFPNPEYPVSGLCNYNNTSALVGWLVGRLGVVPDWDNDTPYPQYPLLLRDALNSSFPEIYFWGYQIRGYSSERLDVSIRYESSGLLRDVCLIVHDASLFPTDGSFIETAYAAADRLGIPLGNHTVMAETIVTQYVGKTATAVLLSESIQGHKLLGLNLAAFWFDQADTLRQIQFYVYYQFDNPSVQADQALLAGREGALEEASARGLTTLLNETILGLRLVPLSMNGAEAGENITSPIVYEHSLCYEYVAEFKASVASLTLHVVAFVDAHNGSVVLSVTEAPPVETVTTPIPGGVFVVLFFALVAVVGLVMTVPSVSLGASSILCVLTVWRKGPQALDNFNRGRIVGFITAKPGCTYTEIKEATAISNGTLSYHLKVLERLDLIESTKDGRSRRYSVVGVSLKEHRVALVGRTEARILAELEGEWPLSCSEVARRLGMSRQRISHNLRLLARRGILVKDGNLWRAITRKNP